MAIYLSYGVACHQIALYKSILASPHRTLNGDEADFLCSSSWFMSHNPCWSCSSFKYIGIFSSIFPCLLESIGCILLRQIWILHPVGCKVHNGNPKWEIYHLLYRCLNIIQIETINFFSFIVFNFTIYFVKISVYTLECVWIEDFNWEK